MDIIQYYTNFIQGYNTEQKDTTWKQQSQAFKDFWNNRVLNQAVNELNDEEIDDIVRILDKKGKGNTKIDEAIAIAMIPQGVWRRMFNEIHATKDFSTVINQIFLEQDLATKADLIDKLYELNSGRKNSLSGQSGSAINCLLAAYNPFQNLSMVSLNDRLKLMQFFNIKINNWDSLSTGQKIVQSNYEIVKYFRDCNINDSVRTISEFLYSPDFKSMWKNHTIRRDDKIVSVSVPFDTESDVEETTSNNDVRESIRMQALLAKIGALMGMKIWIPQSDRTRVMKEWKELGDSILNNLPLNYDETTIKTIEQIDVLWLKGRAIIRAFEVEHTTSIYSGILRMADLLALQPNMNIKLHIVAPYERRDKVFSEIKRPVFSLLERGPLSECCTYISYDDLKELAELKHLAYLSDSVLDEYAEDAE